MLYFENHTEQKAKIKLTCIHKTFRKSYFSILFFWGGGGVFHSQVTATGLHISKQCFLLFFLYDYCYYNFYKTPLQLVSVFISSIFNFSSTVFFFFVFPIQSDEICLIFLCWFSCERFLIFCMAWFVFFAIYIFAFFPALIALMVLGTVLPPCSLTLFQHGKSSTTVNSAHFPLHPSCLLFLPVAPQCYWLQVSTVLWKRSQSASAKVKMESIYEKRLRSQKTK